MHIDIDTVEHAQTFYTNHHIVAMTTSEKHMVSLVLTCHLSAGSCHMFDNAYFTEHTHIHTHSLVRLCVTFLDPPS